MSKPSRAERKREYESVCRIVEYNADTQTGPPVVRRSSVLQIAASKGIDPDAADRRLDAARENGDLIAHRGHLVHTNDDAHLVAVIEWAASQVPPDQALVAKCNRARRRAEA